MEGIQKFEIYNFFYKPNNLKWSLVTDFGFCQFNFKINRNKPLISHGFKICFAYHEKHQEFNFLRSFSVHNGYPSTTIG